jgi:hypothetical protein
MIDETLPGQQLRFAPARAFVPWQSREPDASSMNISRRTSCSLTISSSVSRTALKRTRSLSRPAAFACCGPGIIEAASLSSPPTRIMPTNRCALRHRRDSSRHPIIERPGETRTLRRHWAYHSCGRGVRCSLSGRGPMRCGHRPSARGRSADGLRPTAKPITRTSTSIRVQDTRCRASEAAVHSRPSSTIPSPRTLRRPAVCRWRIVRAPTRRGAPSSNSLPRSRRGRICRATATSPSRFEEN